MEAGADLGFAPFGIRAMESMRIEKSYRMVGTEMSIEYPALESGLDRFIRLDKGDFLGREALLRRQSEGLRNLFVTLEVSGHNDADSLGNNPLFSAGEMIGRTTSGAYGFRVGKSLALAMVRPDHAAEGTQMEMDLLGAPCIATVLGESPHDPENALLRA